MAVGNAVIDFGAFPGSNEASVAVTGQAAIASGSKVEAYFMAESSADHSIGDHQYAPLFIECTCGNLVAGTGFTIYGRSKEKMQGKFTVEWVWS